MEEAEYQDEHTFPALDVMEILDHDQQQQPQLQQQGISEEWEDEEKSISCGESAKTDPNAEFRVTT